MGIMYKLRVYILRYERSFIILVNYHLICIYLLSMILRIFRHCGLLFLFCHLSVYSRLFTTVIICEYT
jgi:hypothetical protein